MVIFLVLLLAVVVHRKKQDHWNEKELDDIRETIINYEDEGGGEVDTGFDLELLRRENQFDENIKKPVLYYGRGIFTIMFYPFCYFVHFCNYNYRMKHLESHLSDLS